MGIFSRLKGFLEDLSLVSRKLRHKLAIAFSLMSVIPLLICGYLTVTYIFPTARNIGTVSIIVALSILLAFLGLKVTKEVIEEIVRVALDTQIIAEGDLERQIKVKRDDEIGDLSLSINRLTNRIKDNMKELKFYGEQTKKINLEIHKKVLALSSLLQIGNLMSAGCELDEVLSLITEKISQIEDGGGAFLMLVPDNTKDLVMECTSHIEKKGVVDLKTNVGEGVLGEVAFTNAPLIIDSHAGAREKAQYFQEGFGMRNIAVFPVTLSGKVIGLMGAGNNLDDFIYKDDELELIKVFTKQISIAIENDLLLRKTEELAVKDGLTGLYNEHYIRQRLDEEIRRAIHYQRPCSFILFNLDNFSDYRARYGNLAAESALKRIGILLKEYVTDIDRTARFGDDEFAVLLPERNKKKAVGVAEEIRKKVEFIFKEEEMGAARLTMSGGVSENPIDGITADELIAKALEGIKKAKSGGKNKIVV